MKTRFATLLFGFLFLGSCSNNLCPKNQSNPILNSNDADSKLYQQELARLIKLKPELVIYYFQKRLVKNAQNFIALEAIGPDFCGEIHVLIKTEDEQSLKLQNKSGYSGAGLRGLKLKFSEIGTPIYHSMTAIVD